jgi:cell division protein FtsQ
MAKSKMAVRKPVKKNKRQLNLDFNLAPKAKKLFRISLILSVVATFYFSVQFVGKQWESVWPVNQVVIQTPTSFIKQADLVTFIKQQNVQGMLAIDLVALQNKTKQLPWIKQVVIRKVWPETLVFEIEEHQAVARFNTNGKTYLLTQQGTKIEFSQADEIAVMPSIQALAEIKSDREFASKEAVAVWQEFKQIKREFEIIDLSLNQLTLDTISNWKLGFEQSLQMNLGRKQRFERVQRLVNAYSQIENKQQIETIDLRYHNGLAVGWQQTTPSTEQNNKS